MRRLTSFTNISLDGYFAGTGGDFSWAHRARQDTEWNDFVAGNASGGGVLVFGRLTYEMMAGYWPTPMAAQNDPVVAERMNNLPKVVFSRTLSDASWNNTTLVKTDLTAAIRQMKSESGPDMAILGSGSIVSQLAAAGLIDEIQLVVNPIVLGVGKKLFNTVKQQLPLKLVNTRAFGNGNVVVSYQPVDQPSAKSDFH